MQAKLLYLSDFLHTCWQQPKRGKPQTNSSRSFILFFRLLKRIHAFAAMHRWAKANYEVANLKAIAVFS